jgi:O-antigen ligase
MAQGVADMKRPYWLLLFPLSVMAFVAPAVTYFNLIFTTTTRWVVIAALTLVLVGTGRAFSVLRHDVGLIVAVYVIWCIFTFSWSEVPELTLMKSGALALVGIGLLAGGEYWVVRLGWERALSYLFPILGLALFAGVFGQEAIEQSEGLTLYEGMTSNPNMLGSLMNMAVPLLLWQSYRSRGSQRQLVLWLGLLGVVLGVLLISVSRSSIIAALTTCGVFLVVVGVRRSAFLYALAAILLCGSFMAVPDVYETLDQRYVRKAPEGSNADILNSRQELWEESYEQALKGGYVGGGYGVTIGDTDFVGGLTAVGYGREKGNSQLAIMEETGIVGLVLYIVFLVVLFHKAALSVRQSIDPDMKVMAAILLGALAGQTAQSLFEAWWVAPGSPEAAYFWAMSGVAIGFSVESRKRVTALKRVAMYPLPEQF